MDRPNGEGAKSVKYPPEFENLILKRDVKYLMSYLLYGLPVEIF